MTHVTGQPTAQSCIFFLSSEVALTSSASQSLWDPSSHHIYSKALTAGHTERKENLASLLGDTGCCKPSGRHPGTGTTEQTPECLQLQMGFGKAGTSRANVCSVCRFACWFFKFLCAEELVRKKESAIVSDRRALQCSGAVSWGRNWDGTNLSESQAISQGDGTKAYLPKAQGSTLHLELMVRNLQIDNSWPSVWFAKESFPTFLCQKGTKWD